MSDIPEMSVQSTLTESTMQDEDISHSKTTVNALADVSNSTGPCSIPDISSRAQYRIVNTRIVDRLSKPFNEYLKKYLKVLSDQINLKKSLCTL